jgi:hypothetical protein
MKLYDIIQRATEFGTLRSRDYFLSFILKIILYIIPAVILGNYTDILVQKLNEDKLFGDHAIYYILLQTFIIVSTLYIFLVFLSKYVSEFHFSLAGAYFIVLYFGIQTNYIQMIKKITTPNW